MCRNSMDVCIGFHTYTQGSLVQLGVYTRVGPMALPPLSLLLTLRDLTSSSLLAPLAHVDPGRRHALFPVWCDCAEEGGL